MELALNPPTASWSSGPSAMVLSDIFSANTSVAIWNREPNVIINAYFEQAFFALGLGIRGVFPMTTLTQALTDTLPEKDGKQEAVEDIYLLSDMLTCLFDCDSVGLRLVPLKSAMCPKFHVDNIPVRLVNTYLGSGTEWLPLEAVKQTPLDLKQGAANKASSRYEYNPEHIQQMKAFDVGLLKGKAWTSRKNGCDTPLLSNW